MIILSKTQLNEIQLHGKEAYPEECCGAMLGKVNSNNEKVTEKIFRIENNWENVSGTIETKNRRFAITAEDYKKLELEAKNLNLTLLGFYHTHPDHPAEPSGTDLSYAWPFFSYIIQSIKNRNADVINSFELDLDTNQFIKEELKII